MVRHTYFVHPAQAFKLLERMLQGMHGHSIEYTKRPVYPRRSMGYGTRK